MIATNCEYIVRHKNPNKLKKKTGWGTQWTISETLLDIGCWNKNVRCRIPSPKVRYIGGHLYQIASSSLFYKNTLLEWCRNEKGGNYIDFVFWMEIWNNPLLFTFLAPNEVFPLVLDFITVIWDIMRWPICINPTFRLYVPTQSRTWNWKFTWLIL